MGTAAGFDPRPPFLFWKVDSVADLTVAQYAATRKARGLPGGTRKAVHEALKQGRIACEPNGKIDPEKADKAWEDNTDPVNRRHPADREQPAAGNGGTSPVAKLTEARANREEIRAKSEAIKLARQEGQLIDAQLVYDAVSGYARSQRDLWTQWVTKSAPKLVSEITAIMRRSSGKLDAREFEIYLEKLVKKQLEDIAQIEFTTDR